MGLDKVKQFRKQNEWDPNRGTWEVTGQTQKFGSLANNIHIPCRAILPVVLSESSELEHGSEFSALKIVFEVVFLGITSKKAGDLEEEHQ